jgi:hypothetical protein
LEVNQILTLALRPKGLDQLVGAKKWVANLRERMKTRPPQAILLHGAAGTGKTSTSRILALSFQCSHQEIFGQPCAACTDKAPEWLDGKWGQFNVHEINASDVNGVEEIGKLVQLANYSPMPPSLKRVFILDECQRVTSAAQQLLLKPTEHPAKDTIWIIATTEPNKLAAALQRRFVSYALFGLNPERTEILLKRAAKFIGFQKPLESLIKELDRTDTTSPALILMAFEHFVSGQEAKEAVAAIANASVGKTDSFAVCKAVLSGNWNSVRTLLAVAIPEESRWLRASVLGYFRGALLRASTPEMTDRLSLAIRTLTAPAPLEDALLYSWLVATFALMCKQMRAR